MSYKNLLLLHLILISALSTTLQCKPPTKAAASEEKQYKSVTITIAQPQDIAINRDLSGPLNAKGEVVVMPKAAGEIQSVVVEVGDRVSNGSILAYIDDQDYKLGTEQAKAALAMAEAGLNQAEREFERQQKLKMEGAVAEQTYEQVKTGVEVAQAQLEQAKVGLAMANNQLEYTRISSPISGYVADKFIQKGQLVSQQVPAFRIVNSDTLEMVVSVNVEDLTEVKLNEKVTVKLNGSIDKEYTGLIASLPVAADSRSNLFNIKIYVPNRNNEALPGTIGNVQLPIQKLTQAYALPSDVVLKRTNGNFIMKYVAGKAVEVAVTTGKSWGDSVQILEGLALNDTVIVKGAHYLKDGDLVSIKETEVAQ
jgi:RND family efflux transporter MFP subunit